MRVDSPFDYPHQCGLYLPRHIPEPAEPGFTDAVCDEVERLLKLTGGLAFVLFTSLKHMEQVQARVAPKLDVPALLQGERPKRALLDSRLTRRRYGRAFLDALPPAKRLFRFEDVQAFWNRGG